MFQIDVRTDTHPASKLRFLVTFGATEEEDEDVGDEEMHTPPPGQPNRILIRYERCRMTNSNSSRAPY